MSAAHGGQMLRVAGGRRRGPRRLPRGSRCAISAASGCKDLATPEHVYQVVHPRLRQDFPALRSLEATPNNLPQQLTSFIGRERELREVKDCSRRRGC